MLAVMVVIMVVKVVHQCVLVIVVMLALVVQDAQILVFQVVHLA